MGRRSVLILSLGTFLSLTLLAEPAFAFTETPVRATPREESVPAATDGYIGWSQNSRADPRHFDAFVQPDGSSPFQVNTGRSEGFIGGFDGTQLLYQQVSNGGQSDLMMMNVATRLRSAPLAGIDTTQWEWSASFSGDQYLFNRKDVFESPTVQRVILHDATTGHETLLAKGVRGRSFVQAGQVNGDYATWQRCTIRCNVVYQISTKTTQMVPNPQGKFQYSPSVAVDGTVYFIYSGNACGKHVALESYPFGGSVSKLLALPAGHDVFETYTFTDAGGHTSVYEQYVGCRAGTFDIYKVAVT